jgi:hypothetical protein
MFMYWDYPMNSRFTSSVFLLCALCVFYFAFFAVKRLNRKVRKEKRKGRKVGNNVVLFNSYFVSFFLGSFSSIIAVW